MEKEYQSFKELTDTAASFLKGQFYSNKVIDQYRQEWKRLGQYMTANNITVYKPDVGIKYLLETIEVIEERCLPRSKRNKIRTVTVLSDFAATGSIRKRKKREMPRSLDGPVGKMMAEYIVQRHKLQNLSLSTRQSMNRYLSVFLDYLDSCRIPSLEKLTPDLIVSFADYLHNGPFSVITTHLIILKVNQFLSHLYTTGILKVDYSRVMPKDKYVRQPKLPSCYSEEEVKLLVGNIDRANPKGKRDYAMVLLVVRLGLRCFDVSNLQFQNIIWESGVISLTQQKTREKLELPLFVEIGDAIIDYLKHGRPKSNLPFVFLRQIPPYDNMDHNALNGIIKKYISRSGIKYDERHHGPHAFRHSLATSLLAKETPLPVISSVLGHKHTESTMFYLRVDVNTLKKCAIEVPPMENLYQNQEKEAKK